MSQHLQHALDKLESGEATVPDVLLSELLSPVALACPPGAAPAFHTLPLSRQAELLLLLRAAPHRFSAPQVAALLQGLQLTGGPSGSELSSSPLLHILAHDLLPCFAMSPGGSSLRGALEEPPIPPCPDFLFSASPAFPWAPKLWEPGAPLPFPLSGAPQGAGAANLAAPMPARMAAPVPSRQEQLDRRKRAAVRDTDITAVAAQGGAHAAEAADAAKRQRVALGASSEDEEEDADDEDMLGHVRAEGAAQAAPGGMAASMAVAAAAGAAAPPQQASGAAPVANGALDFAAAALQRALVGAGAGGAAEPSLSPEARQALGVVLSAAAAAAGTAGTATVLTQAGLDSLADDNALLLVVREAVGPATAFACSSVVAGALLLPRLQALAAPPSRALAAAVEHLGSAAPQALLHSCLRTLLSAPGLNQQQAELLARAAKDWLPPSLLPSLLDAACSGSSGSGGAAAGTHWNEHLVGVVQAALGLKLELPQVTLAALAGALQGAASQGQLQSSVKFGKLLVTAVKQYSSQLGPHKQQLQATASATKTFMTKQALAAVAKL